MNSETLKNLLSVKRGLEQQIKSAQRCLQLIAFEIEDYNSQNAVSASPLLDSDGNLKPHRPYGRRRAEDRAWRVWEKLPAEGITVAGIRELAEAGLPPRKTLSDAAYFHVVRGWLDLNVIEVLEEGSGQRRTKYKKVKP